MSTTTNNLCIIPARGGSKRIPRKNIKDFLGKPIIAYSIDAALKCGLFREVMVSTDDSEIAEVALHLGASVPFLRSPESANDFATTLDVLKEVVMEYERRKVYFDNICCIYATAPFVNDQILKSSFRTFIEEQYESLFPILKYSFPIQRSLSLREKRVSFNWPEHVNTRSQDLDDIYHDAGQFYWLKKSVLSNEAIVTSNSGGYLISELQAQDIDNETDWKLAEMKYRLKDEHVS